MRGVLSQLWRRPAGLGEVFYLALPLVLSTISYTLMQFTDRLFLTWHSQQEVAAALPGGALAFAVLCLPLGIASYVTTFVAQYQGARQQKKIGAIVWQGIWLGLLTAPLVAATLPWIERWIEASGQDAALVRLEVDYYLALAWGAGPMVVSAALSSFFTGRGQTVVVMLVDTFAAALNIVLDYAWIFGAWGFPEAGITGAGWATSVSLVVKLLIYFTLWLRPATRAECAIWAGCRIDGPLLRRLLKYGAPGGLQWLLEVGGFGVFLLLVGRLGEVPLAATSLAINVNMLAFMPILGLGMATTTLVGQRLGQNQPELAARAAWSAALLAVAYMIVLSLFYLFTPGLFLLAHALQTPAEEFVPVRDLTIVLLRFVAAYCIFDALNVVFCSAIKGAGDTRFVLLATIVTSTLAVLSTWLGLQPGTAGLYWCWGVLTGWVFALGVIYWARFQHGAWRKMRVIETPPPEDEGWSSADEPEPESAPA